MTTEERERIAHGVSESFWTEQALNPAMSVEDANLFAERAELHATAAWATAEVAEVIELPEAPAQPVAAAA